MTIYIYIYFSYITFKIKYSNIIFSFCIYRKCHLISFYFSFFYLLFLSRLGDYIGLPIAPSHTNLILMILTLKLSGLAFEINDSINAPADDIQGINSEAMKNIGFLDVFHYGFGYMGLMTGMNFCNT